jgi:nitrite reductase/ring-hydroxylating ferredoxin subunit
MLSQTTTKHHYFVPCIRLEDLPSPGSATSRNVGGVTMCIAVDPHGAVFALADQCPPVGKSLSLSKVNSDGTIQDPVLGTKFCLRTGHVVGEWCPDGIGRLFASISNPEAVATFPLKQKGRSLTVEIDAGEDVHFESNYWSKAEGHHLDFA